MAELDLNPELNYDQLLATFADEATEEIAALETGLLALETSPEDADLRGDLLRYAHTLKGNASCVGLTTLTSFAHAYEEMLERMDGSDPEVDRALASLLLSGVDTFRRMVTGGLVSTNAAGQQSSAGNARRSLRVSAERLNRMLDLAGEISIARGRVQQLLATEDIEELIETERELDFLHGELQEMIMRARMVPVGPLFRQYARTVRDLAATHGKSARLVTAGDDVEIDTTAVEMLRDPLMHMIRNAIDHGLELPEQRTAAGKAPTGTISLEACHEAGSVIIKISDDGAGLDREAIAARAERLGIDATDLDRVIFENGFSTTEEANDLSGRGVGMDVVRRGIESLRGTIKIESRPGLGTTFTIRLPLTLAVIDGFGVSAADETWVVPMANVLECVELPESEPKDATSGVLLLRDEIVPYVRLRTLYSLTGEIPARENVLVVQHDGMKGGLVVDELHGASQAVIKPLGDYFAEVPGIAGSSILGSGRVALILDVRAIFDRMEKDNATE
jgi:two-component system chemotaxis sensor kinase CheA